MPPLQSSKEGPITLVTFNHDRHLLFKDIVRLVLTAKVKTSNWNQFRLVLLRLSLSKLQKFTNFLSRAWQTFLPNFVNYICISWFCSYGMYFHWGPQTLSCYPQNPHGECLLTFQKKCLPKTPADQSISSNAQYYWPIYSVLTLTGNATEP